MRPVHGAAPGASLAEHWETIRDTQRAAVPGEIVPFVEAHEPMVPSKAHVRRLRRDRTEAFKAEPKPAVAPVSPRVAFMRQQQAELAKLVKVSQSAPLPAMSWDASRHAFTNEKAPTQRASAAPLTREQLGKRADAAKAEFHRLARFCDHSDEWKARRRYALDLFKRAQEAYDAAS